MGRQGPARRVLRDARTQDRFCRTCSRARSSESDSKVMPMISGPCETARKHADAGDRDPGLGAGDGRLEVFGEAAVASEPGEGSFDYPSFWLRLEGSDTLASRDDLDRPFSQVGDC